MPGRTSRAWFVPGRTSRAWFVPGRTSRAWFMFGFYWENLRDQKTLFGTVIRHYIDVYTPIHPHLICHLSMLHCWMKRFEEVLSRYSVPSWFWSFAWCLPPFLPLTRPLVIFPQFSIERTLRCVSLGFFKIFGTLLLYKAVIIIEPLRIPTRTDTLTLCLMTTHAWCWWIRVVRMIISMPITSMVTNRKGLTFVHKVP